MPSWEDALAWEQDWWGNCCNTLGEEQKQLVYARKMGLGFHHDGKSPHNIDLNGASVLDVGGGPVSLLLKCVNFSRAKVVDPIQFPSWVLERYRCARIEFEQVMGEHMDESGWDECWVYNVLPHVENPYMVIRNAKKAAKVVRIFDWINTHLAAGHPQSVTAEELDGWLGGEGRVELINIPQCRGLAYYGIFV